MIRHTRDTHQRAHKERRKLELHYPDAWARDGKRGEHVGPVAEWFVPPSVTSHVLSCTFSHVLDIIGFTVIARVYYELI